jgi:N-acetylglucosamine malate deacetylase 1
LAKATVLAIGAHPDDIEINCSGTLKLLGSLGLEIHVATMTLGDCGSQELSREDIAAKRRREAESACKLLEARYHNVGSSDFCIFNDDEHNRQVTSLLRSVAPDLVFTHPPQDYLLDHETTSTLVRNACFYAPVPNYDTSHISDSTVTSHIPHLYYFDVMEGVDMFGKPVVPQFFIDVSDVMQFKLKMLAQHESQREWLTRQHALRDYLLGMQSWAGERGKQASDSGRSVCYAEAFRQHRGHAYPHDNVLQEWLGERLIVNTSY